MKPWMITKRYRPEDEAAEGAVAPKPKDGAAAGGAALGAPKMKAWEGVGAGTEFRGAADGAGGWLSWFCPKRKALAGGPSLEVAAGWPNMKVLGAAACVELLLLPNRLGAGVEDAEVVELVVLVGLLAIKENAGFGEAAESVGRKRGNGFSEIFKSSFCIYSI